MNPTALVAVWNFLKTVDQDAITGLNMVVASGGPLLPASLVAFEKEVQVGLKAFLSLDPLVQVLAALVPPPLTGTTKAPV